ncbi:hypothetical protein N8772_00500 [Rickettsiales bacterium]|nr:hypothetical protein [Rickettsiales bacterium]
MSNELPYSKLTYSQLDKLIKSLNPILPSARKSQIAHFITRLKKEESENNDEECLLYIVGCVYHNSSVANGFDEYIKYLEKYDTRFKDISRKLVKDICREDLFNVYNDNIAKYQLDESVEEDKSFIDYAHDFTMKEDYLTKRISSLPERYLLNKKQLFERDEKEYEICQRSKPSSKSGTYSSKEGYSGLSYGQQYGAPLNYDDKIYRENLMAYVAAEGGYVGIGVSFDIGKDIAKEEKKFIISDVVEGSYAAKLGIKKDDIIELKEQMMLSDLCYQLRRGDMANIEKITRSDGKNIEPPKNIEDGKLNLIRNGAVIYKKPKTIGLQQGDAAR